MRRALAFTVVGAIVVACSSYGAGEPEPTTPDASASSSSGGGSSSGGTSTSSSGGSSSGATGDGGNVDAAQDGSTFTETCPPCGGTCVAAGCNGGSASVTCSKPYDVTSTTTLVVFACPQGPTTTLPNQPACGNGGAKHGAPIRLGSSANGWRVKVEGANPFVIVGDCTNVGAGSCSSSSAQRDVPTLANVFVGTTTTNLASCAQLSVTFTAL